MIVIVSHSADLHACAVLNRLAACGAKALLLDTAAFPQQISMVVKAGGQSFDAHLEVGADSVALQDISSVWWRRPKPHEISPALSNRDDWQFAYGECAAAMSGLFSAIDAFWINEPLRDEKAAQKLYQLKLARLCGLRPPRTCITNDPDAAGLFIAAEGETGTIYKAFSATERAWRETRLLREDELQHIANVRHAPVIFQEYIKADVDLRITVIGDEIFPAAIYSQETDYKVDFRMTMHEARFEPHRLPAAVEDGLRQLMRRLGLVYGAIDMRLTPDGEYVFLEVNPCGQWLFVEQKTGQDITGALTSALLSQGRETNSSLSIAAE